MEKVETQLTISVRSTHFVIEAFPGYQRHTQSSAEKEMRNEEMEKVETQLTISVRSTHFVIESLPWVPETHTVKCGKRNEERRDGEGRDPTILVRSTHFVIESLP